MLLQFQRSISYQLLCCYVLIITHSYQNVNQFQCCKNATSSVLHRLVPSIYLHILGMSSRPTRSEDDRCRNHVPARCCVELRSGEQLLPSCNTSQYAAVVQCRKLSIPLCFLCCCLVEEPLCIYIYPGERLHKGLHGHYFLELPPLTDCSCFMLLDSTNIRRHCHLPSRLVV